MRPFLFAVISSMMLATHAAAQKTAPDCTAPANDDNPECLNLPPAQEATNFVPLIAPALGGLAAVAGLAAAAAGGGEAGNTTTSTTSTVPN